MEPDHDRSVHRLDGVPRHLEDGSKWVRKHGEPITPAQRLIDHPDVSTDNKIRLEQQMKSLNPFALQKRIQSRLKVIFKRLR
jgi:hypothetical protein